MEFIVEKSLKDFDFWGEATWFANQLTDDQFDLIESYLESAKCEGEYYTDTKINDIFWHDPESLYPALPIDDLCRIILYSEDNEEYNDLVDDFIDNYHRLDRLDYTESDIKEAWIEWLEEETLGKEKEIINGKIKAYVENNVHRFAERYDLALEKIGEMRCPLSMADDSLFNDIRDAVDDWCSDNDKDPEDYDIEEMFG